MDIHIWISIYGYPYMGTQGSLGGIHGYLGGTDGTLGPMGPWDRWDLGLMGPGPQGPPIIKLDIGPVKRKFRNARPGRIPGPGRSGPDAGPVIRRAEFFRIFFSRPGPVLWFFLIEINTFWPKKNFSSFFILIHPEPPPKPSYVPKKHPQTIKKKIIFS